MAKRRDSAGLVIYRRRPALEFFLVHPGGPYWARKDDGAWSIPKGEIDVDRDPLAEARREFAEETGQSIEACGFGGAFLALESVQQAGGKVVEAWVADQGFDNGSLLFINCTQCSLRVDSSRKLNISLVFVHSFAIFRLEFNTKVAFVNNFV